MIRLKNISAATASVLLLGSAVFAQDLTHKAPPQTGTIVLVNARVHTISDREISDGFVVIEEGKIADFGSMSTFDSGVLDGSEVIDCEGLRVYPGLISASSNIGLNEVSSVRATIDTTETGNLTPEVRAAVAVNPDSWHFPVARSNGVLTFGVRPSGGSIPGRMSVMRADGWTWEDMTVLGDGGLLINWPNVRPTNAWWMNQSEEEQLKRSREAVQAIDEAFSGAEAYFAARESDGATLYSLRFDAMGPALRGETPVYISAQELDQIRSAVTWATDRGLKPIIVGGRDAHLCTNFLKRHDVGVIVTGTLRMPRRSDAAYDEAFTLPAALEGAGVKWCLAGTGGSSNDRNLPYHAAMAVAYGLDHDAALRSITLSAAELLGVGDRLGSIEKGKDATLIVTTGDPLEMATQVELAFIDGRRIDLSNKQTDLAKKYREKYRQLGLTPNEN
jgi:imidazolonepropionase-like amidohydrolase